MLHVVPEAGAELAGVDSVVVLLGLESLALAGTRGVGAGHACDEEVRPRGRAVDVLDRAIVVDSRPVACEHGRAVRVGLGMKEWVGAGDELGGKVEAADAVESACVGGDQHASNISD